MQSRQIIRLLALLHLLTAMPLPTCSLAQTDTSDMGHDFIFNSQQQLINIGNYDSIYSVMAKYYQGVEQARLDLLEKVFHPKWLMKDTDSPNARYLNTEDKTTFIKRVRDHGPYEGYAKGRDIAEVGIAYSELAYVRVNKDASRNATVFFFFNVDSEWLIMDKIFVIPREEQRLPVSEPSSFREVEQLLQGYFKAIAKGDTMTISDLLHQDWDLKFLNNGINLRIENKETYLSGVAPGDQLEYNVLLSIDMIHEGLAVARADLPSLQKTYFIVLLKVNGEWKMVNERRSCRRMGQN